MQSTLERSELPLTFTGAYARSSSDKSDSLPAVDLPILVRFQPLYVPYWGWQGPVFLLNSWLAIICCDPQTNLRVRHLPKLRLAFLPSSLSYRNPHAFQFSWYLPVSVCGTDSNKRLFTSFLGTRLSNFPLAEARESSIFKAIALKTKQNMICGSAWKLKVRRDKNKTYRKDRNINRLYIELPRLKRRVCLSSA